MKILIVLTNQKTIGTTEKQTGFHFSEFSHPYMFFMTHGYSVIVASPLGGICPITSPHPEDKINAFFYSDPEKMKIIERTVKLDTLVNERFDGIYIAGGHGTMFDFPNNVQLSELIKNTLVHGGVVGAVCHGPAAFVGAKDKSGKYIVDGKKVNSFTNTEEKLTPYYEDMPFLLESKLIEQGAHFESSGPREPHCAVDSNIVTGQNPESIELVTGAMHSLLQSRL